MSEGAGCWSQLGLVMWRQVWLVRVRRHYVITLAQLAVMLLVLSSVWDESVAPFHAGPHKDHFFDSADAIEFWGRPNESWTNGEVAFAPDQAFFADLVQKVCDSLKGTWKPVPFKNHSLAARYAEQTPSSGSDLESRRVAVCFDRPADDRLTYHVHIHDARFDTHDDYLRGLLVPGPFDTDRFDEMRLLLPIQYFIESLFIEAMKNSSKRLTQTKVELMRFPYPRLFYGSEDRTLSRVALRFAVGFFVPFCFLVVKLVHEKRTGRKDMLRRAGLTDVSYWMGYFFEMSFVIGCAMMLMYVPLFLYHNSSGTAFLQYVDAGLFMAVLAVFGVLTIMHAMLLSIFFWEPCVAFAAAVVYWFLLGLLPYAVLQNPLGYGYYLTSRFAKLTSALTPAMYLHWCLRAIERFEKYELGLTWKNSFDSAATLDNVNVGELSMLALSTTLILAGLIWYLDNVVPWGYGVPKPFYFIFSADYWSPYRKWDIRDVSTGLDPLYFERHDARKVDPVIHFRDLTAVGRNSVDIKNVNLTIFNRQITVILGPQNCGHSTMLDIVIGMHRPTSGEAHVCNFDVTSSSGCAWEYFSVCPDEGALFDDLTVEEHLLFFATLRLQSPIEAETAVSSVLPQLNLEPFKDSLVSHLPQRLRRALCVAITICGVKQTPLLIFGEPTKLMDPKHRHEVWEVLARVSRRSAVLVTTQSIEEAEVLADRLIIMRDGQVVCAGSPMWLKTQFDSGYFLRFTKLPNFRDNDVKRVVQYHMGEVEPTRVTKLEMVFNLTDSTEYHNHMAAMLHYLEKRRSLLGIASMSLTSCTMEDIYIRLVTGTEGAASKALIAPRKSMSDSSDKLELDAVKQLCTARATNAGSCAILMTLMRKRALIWTRVWWTKPLTVGIPVLSLILLAFCERQLLPALNPERETLTYVPETFFDRVYGFIEAANESKKFTDNVLLPLMNEHSVKVFSATNPFVERELLFWAQENIYAYIYHYQMGISVLGERVFLWYNGQCPHSASLVVNMFHTALLRNLTGKKGSAITLINSPLANSSLDSRLEFERINGRLSLQAGQPSLGHEAELFAIRNVFTRILYAFFLSVCMSLYVATHVFAPMVERNSGLKHMQLMTGMSGGLYWTGHLLFDFIMACWASIFFTCMIFLSNTDMGPDYQMGILVLFLANAFSSLPLTYLVSLMFRSPTSAFCVLSLVLFVAGMVGSAGVEMLKALMQQNPSTVYSVTFFIWGFVFRWFPTYSLVRGIVKVKLLFKFNALCRAGGELLAEACRDPNFANDDRVSRCCQARLENVTARLLLPLEPFYETGFYEAGSMVVEGLLYVAMLSFVDSSFAYTLRAYMARYLLGTADEDEAAEEKGPRLVATSLDPEVEREEKLVNQVCRTRAFKDVAMAIRNLQKTVGLLTKVKIVDGASILLNQGECLGIVGVNCSGKTTLLEILVGLVVPTGGGAYTSALSLGGDLRSWQQSIGYAPDGISEQGLPPLTVGEFLDMVARLRGVTARRFSIASALSLLSGRLKEDKLINACSHGELKMLLISSAAIGVPPILLVDEPYSDVEPLYRNDIIHMLQVLKGSQAMSIIMTSHRMSHCEVVCDRVAVIEDGKFEALGDPLQMNQKYGRSYVVSIRLPPERRFDYALQYYIGESMQEAFHQCTFCYNYKGVMNFTVGTTYTSWSELFAKMTTIQRNHGFPEFSLGDITLEHIFVGLARRQILFAGVRPHSLLSGFPSRVASRAASRGASRVASPRT